MNRRSFLKGLFAAAVVPLLVVQSSGYVDTATEALLEKTVKSAKAHAWFDDLTRIWNEDEGEWNPNEARRRIFGKAVIDRIDKTDLTRSEEMLDECGTVEHNRRVAKARYKIESRDNRIRRRDLSPVKVAGYKDYDALHDPNALKGKP